MPAIHLTLKAHAGEIVPMQHPDVKELLTSGQVAAVLHRSSSTISRWAKSGELRPVARIAVAHGVFLFDPEDVKKKAIELALGPDHGQTLELDLPETPKRKAG
jgi:helix-turn-helix protein